MNKILFCGYRSWALKAHDKLVESLVGEYSITLVTTPEQLLEAVRKDSFSMIFIVGWSWRVPNDVLDNNYVVGMHPSDLPAFAGGSPIQNQILDGVKETKASIFRLTSKMDGGPIVCKRPFSLVGHMPDIFDELSRVTCEMLHDIARTHPITTETPQPSGGFRVARLKPNQSKLDKEQLVSMKCVDLYDSIRCREDPYPNVYIEDETGKLYFKLVEFEPA